MCKWKSLCALGLMSGTSMDGVDAALLSARIEDDRAILQTLGAQHKIAFDDTLRRDLGRVLGTTARNDAIDDLERRLGVYYHRAVVELCTQAGLPLTAIDVIGLHGQTITHRPEHRFTWQLGDGAALAQSTAIPVVYDFRQQDIGHGGQGAPLAPVFHQALAEAGFLPPRPLAVVNIGGISNITLLKRDSLHAYDCGPGNGPIDDYVRTKLNRPYDNGGEIAATGHNDLAVIEQFLQHPYFALPAPKSLDREDFDHRGVEHLDLADAVRTLTACSAAAIAHAIADEHRRCPELRNVLLSGGGRYNITLKKELVERLPKMTIHLIDDYDNALNGDAIEAWAFAWLAILKLCNRPASFPGTTGVATPQTAGIHVLPE